MSKYDLKLGAYLKDNVCTFSIYYYSEKKDDIFLYLYENIEDNLFDYKFVGLSHNTLRGAAGGAVLTAELIKKLGYLD